MADARDARGEPVAGTNPETVRRLDHAIDGYAGARRDTRERIEALLREDPRCVLGQCLDGYLHMLTSKSEATARARSALAAATAAADAAGAARRERLHLAALDAWSSGDMRAAADRWDLLLAEFPRDLVGLKVSQFVLSYLGESDRMRATVARVLPAWAPDVPGYGYVLGCHAYALEEAGLYAEAEEVGRRAVALNPSDIWAAHAVAHVAEMEGRLRHGIEWITGLADEWHDCTNFALHLRWHEGLYHLELEQHDTVLQLYDREVRVEPTDEYLDIANAVSLLWRLEQAEVGVGDRWRELAARAAAREDDHTLVFVDMHYLMALAAASDAAAVERFLESSARFAASGRGTEAAVMADVGLPLARGILAHRRGAYADAVDHVLPVRERVRSIGGSHAQRDVFEQLLIDAAWRGNRLEVAAELLADRLARRPRNLWALRHQARVLDATGSVKGRGEAARARRKLERLRAL